MRTKGQGVKKSKNFADIINGSPRRKEGGKSGCFKLYFCDDGDHRHIPLLNHVAVYQFFPIVRGFRLDYMQRSTGAGLNIE